MYDLDYELAETIILAIPIAKSVLHLHHGSRVPLRHWDSVITREVWVPLLVYLLPSRLDGSVKVSLLRLSKNSVLLK